MRRTTVILTIILLAVAFAGRQAQCVQIKDLNMDVRGLAQFIYSWDQSNGDDQLDTSRLRTTFVVHPSGKVSVYADLEWTDNMSGQSGAAGSRNAVMDGNADSRVVDLYADLYYWNKVTLRVGQFPLPNSYELNTPEYELETVQYSQSAGTFAYRDRGLMLFGDPTKELSWAAWVTNGTGGITGSSSSGDDRSDFGVQFDYFPAPFFSMKIWGLWGEDACAATACDTDTDAFGVGFDYAQRNFHLFGEYNDADLEFGGIKMSDIQQWFLHVSHKIPGTDLQVVLRYDEYEWDLLGAQFVDNRLTTFGVNWDFDENSRLQVMREFVEDENNDKLDVQLSIKF